MPRIRCHYLDCVFLDEGYCGAAAIEARAYQPLGWMKTSFND